MSPKELIEQYKQIEQDCQNFAVKLKTVVGDVLILELCKYLSIEERIKSHISLENKIKKFSSINKPFADVKEVQDLIGLRIITYVYGDIKQIEEVISRNFVAEKLKVEERLGTDRVGYRSHHWLVSFSPERLKLPEYSRFVDFKAELQICTVLQHAWAQIGHNQVYKATAKLPEKIERDFTLLSGLLEIADNEFSRISKEIWNYGQEVKKQTDLGNLELPIDTISLRQFFDEHYSKQSGVNPVFGPNDDKIEEIIEELKNIDISTLKELDQAINKLPFKYESMDDDTNYCGVARLVMIAYDGEKYFEKAWNNKWDFEEGSLVKYRKAGVDIDSLVEKYNVIVHR